MAKYAAFLRGVNVGGRIIKMADLKVCLEKAGLVGVTTLLQSGNVIFESDLNETDLKKRIESALSIEFGYPAKAQIISIDKLARVIKKYPFGTADDEQHDYVIFVENGLEEELVKEDCILASNEQIQPGEGVVYWRVDKGSTLKSSFAKILTKSKYRAFNTNRNLKTLKRVLAAS